MENRPWTNPRDVQLPGPLHPLSKNPERWLPKYNPDDDLLAEEHLHNFMFAMNLNAISEEDCVVRLFMYTFQGSAGSW